MPCRRYLLSYLLATLLPLGFATQTLAGNEAKLLEDLRQLTRESREKQAADRWLQRALDDLVARYDRPWQRTILFEDFNDGDYSHDPSWELLEGRFEVVRGQGLVASDQSLAAQPAPEAAAPANKQPDLAGALVGALLNQAFGPKPGSSQDGASGASGSSVYQGPDRLRLKAGVTNAFAINTSLRASARPVARFEIALLQGTDARYGYRLQIDTAAGGTVELVRLRNGRGSIVESRSLDGAFTDDRLHDLTWQQAPDGTVTVLFDEKPVFQVGDRAFRDGYPWLELTHTSGDITLRSLRIEGT